jgi:hypothetical protein
MYGVAITQRVEEDRLWLDLIKKNPVAAKGQQDAREPCVGEQKVSSSLNLRTAGVEVNPWYVERVLFLGHKVSRE